MRVSKVIRLVFLRGTIALLLAGCPAPTGTADAGEDVPDAGEESADAGDGCVVITLGAQDLQSNLFGQLTGVRFPVSPAIDGPPPEALLVELYDSTTPGQPALTTGTFPLGVAPEDDILTCQHCIWLPLDWDPATPVSKLFIATEGALTLTAVEDPLGPVFSGSTTPLVLREATITEDGTMAMVPGGRCLRAPAISFDTSPTPGRACASAEDCGNPLLEVCSPATNTCGPQECGDLAGGCPAERPVCLVQYGSMSEGACYAACDPTAPSTCRADQTCVQWGVDPQIGICLKTGDATVGDACTSKDTATGCESGLICSAAEHACTNTCSAFSATPGCQDANHACTVLGVCDPLSSGDPATFGQPCSTTSTLAQGCNAASGAFRGICFGLTPQDPLVCEKSCFAPSDCAPEEFCAPRFTSGLGICLPDPVCGDGALGEIDETCDDGNTTSGDGCSADCKTVEYGPICTNAPLLTNGAVTGDTTSAWDGFQATCQLGIARADVYRFQPPGNGRLMLTIDSATTQAISLRTDCADAGTELSCNTSDFSGTGTLTYQVTSPGELTVLVSAFTVVDQGPYTLHTEFVPENCGDGIVAGLEVCDDGNTVSNDGCNATCSAIEYAAYCAQSAPLTSSVTGDNTGAPSVFKESCANSVLGSGPDRLYTYTAPMAGTLHVTLTPDASSSADLVLALFDGCGDPSTMTELGCSSVYETEKVDAAVTAGQTVTILVDGFHAYSTGAYTLSAQLTP